MKTVFSVAHAKIALTPVVLEQLAQLFDITKIQLTNVTLALPQWEVSYLTPHSDLHMDKFTENCVRPC